MSTVGSSVSNDAVALKVTEPTPAAVAVTVLAPAAGPSVQVTDAVPDASVVVVLALTVPAPAVTAQVTGWPAKGFPSDPVTRT